MTYHSLYCYTFFLSEYFEWKSTRISLYSLEQYFFSNLKISQISKMSEGVDVHKKPRTSSSIIIQKHDMSRQARLDSLFSYLFLLFIQNSLSMLDYYSNQTLQASLIRGLKATFNTSDAIACKE